jgi:hypothetical protein
MEEIVSANRPANNENEFAPNIDHRRDLMKGNTRWMLVILILIGGLLLSACGGASNATATKTEPAKLELIEGTELNRVILTERAAQRLDIQTAQVREEQIEGTQRLVIPYDALIYDLDGQTWMYVSPEPLIYFREPITVDYIDGGIVVLLDGPALGTEVVTVGVAELYGTDTGIGK